MKRTDPYTGNCREVTYYYRVSKDTDPNNGFKETDKFRFDIYEHDPEAFVTHYTRQGEYKQKGLAQVCHSRGGLPSAEVAEHLAVVEGLARGWDVKAGGRKEDN